MRVNTAKYLKTIATDTINLGVNSEPVTFYKTVIRTINVMAVINIFLCVVAGFIIHFLSEIKGVLFPALLEALLFAGVLLLNAKKCNSIASAIMFITHCGSFAYFGIKFGPLSHVGILWMYLVCAAYLIFKRNRLRIYGMALATICLIFIEVNYHTGTYSAWNLSSQDIEIVRWCIYGCVGVLGASLMYFFMRRNAQQARRNEMLIAQTTEQYERAANKNLISSQQQELFIRETAHEINNPAHAIMTLASKYLGELRESKPSILSVSREDVEIINTAGHAIQLVASNILAWARLETVDCVSEEQINEGKSGNASLLDIRSTLTRLTALYNVRAKERNVTIRAEFEDVPPLIYFDEDSMLKIIGNLLINAIKFTNKHTEVVLSVTSWGDQLHIVVTDAGNGIPEDKLDKIFQRYYTQGSNIQGNGLGLPLVERLVHELGGRLSVKSKLGVGSSFRVSFPVTIPSAKELQQHNKINVPGPGKLKGTILVADDNALVLKVNEFILKRIGFSVISVDNVLDLINAAKNILPSIILLDVNMPFEISEYNSFAASNGPSCITVARILQADQNTKSIPIVATSGTYWSELLQDLEEAGIQAFIEKPFTSSMLLEVLSPLLPVDCI